MMVQRMSAKEARTRFTDVLGRAYYKGEPTIVEKQGKPVAVVISPADYERYQKLAKERFFQVVRQIQEDNTDADPEEVYRDVAEAVEEVRRKLYAQFQQQQKQALFQAIDEIHERNRDVDPAVIEAEVAQAVRDVRQERHARQTAHRG